METPSVTLSDLARQIRARWRTALATTLLVALAATLAGMTVPNHYTATSTVVVAPMTADPFEQGQLNAKVAMETERVLATSHGVLRDAAARLDAVTEQQLRDATSVVIPANSTVVQIAVNAASPDAAADRANAVAAAYLQQRSGTVAAATATVQADIDRLRARRAGARPGVAAQIDAQLTGLSAQIASLRRVSAFPGQVATPATAPDHPSTPRLLLFITGGLGLGLLAGLAAALLRERTDRRVGHGGWLRQRYPGAVLHDERGGRPAVDRFADLVLAGAGRGGARAVVLTLGAHALPDRVQTALTARTGAGLGGDTGGDTDAAAADVHPEVLIVDATATGTAPLAMLRPTDVVALGVSPEDARVAVRQVIADLDRIRVPCHAIVLDSPSPAGGTR